MRALTKQDLDVNTCDCDEGHCEHSVLYLHPNCHPSAGTWVRYTKGSGELEVTCKKCKRLVCKIAVADPISRS